MTIFCLERKIINTKVFCATPDSNSNTREGLLIESPARENLTVTLSSIGKPKTPKSYPLPEITAIFTLVARTTNQSNS